MEESIPWYRDWCWDIVCLKLQHDLLCKSQCYSKNNNNNKIVTPEHKTRSKPSALPGVLPKWMNIFKKREFMANWRYLSHLPQEAFHVPGPNYRTGVQEAIMGPGRGSEGTSLPASGKTWGAGRKLTFSCPCAHSSAAKSSILDISQIIYFKGIIRLLFFKVIFVISFSGLKPFRYLLLYVVKVQMIRSVL